MKHILPMIIATLGVFVFLGVVIYSGELQIGEAEAVPYHISIDYSSIICSSDIGETEPQPNLQQSKTFHKWALQQCNNTASCTLNTRVFYSSYGDYTPECTDEITVRATCVPKSTSTIEPYSKSYYLYEGQEATLSCS